jgi:transposase
MMGNASEISDRATELATSAMADLHLVERVMAELGITAETIQDAIDLRQTQNSAPEQFNELSDKEWSIIEPSLPLEPRQSNTLDNRAFLNAVLAAMHRGGRWNDSRVKMPYPDAVRRRFGRWAHLSRWQALVETVTKSDLTNERKAQFKAIADRAARLQKNLAS